MSKLSKVLYTDTQFDNHQAIEKSTKYAGLSEEDKILLYKALKEKDIEKCSDTVCEIASAFKRSKDLGYLDVSPKEFVTDPAYIKGDKNVNLNVKKRGSIIDLINKRYKNE